MAVKQRALFQSRFRAFPSRFRAFSEMSEPSDFDVAAAMKTAMDLLAKVQKALSGKKGKKMVAAVAGAAEKPKRAAGAWATWAKHVVPAHRAEFDEFAAAQESKRGLHILFAKKWRDEHPEEYKTFEADFKSSAAATVATSTTVAAAVPAPKKEKKAKEPKESKKKAKVAPAPVVAVEETTVEPWTFKGKKYLRTPSNECWLATEDGEMGAWAGVYDATTDKIDDSVPEPELE